MAQLAIRRATNLARVVPHAAALSARPIRRSLVTLLAVVGTTSLLAGLMPNLSATEFRRFADPFGDNPPFSTVTFTVEPGDTRVTYGAGLDIHATIDGPPVDALELVLRPLTALDSSTAPPSGVTATAEESVLMFPDKPGEWRASISNITRPTAYFVRARTARSARYAIDVITVPQIAEVLVRVAPPAYTRLPPYEGAVPAAGIAGLPGTQVTLSVRSNRPLSRGNVTYTARGDRREFALTPISAGSSTVSGVFPVTVSGRIELQVFDVAGQVSTEEWTAPVTQLVDEQPFVRLIEPRPVSFATPTAVIPVVVSAEDDYGISRLQLFRNLNDSRYLPDGLPVASPPPRHVYQVTRLLLELYDPEPGDEIKLFARVEDNDPHAGEERGVSSTGKGSESSIVAIRIISHEHFEQMRQTREGMETLQAKYQQARRRMEALGEEVEMLRKELQEMPAGDEATEQIRESLKRLAQRMAEESEALRKLSQKKHPFAVDEVLNRELEQMQESVQRLQKRTESLADQPELTREEVEKALEQLAQELRGERERFDQETIEPLETLAAVARIAQDESRFVELYRRQRDLADRLESLKGKDQVDDPSVKSRMRDLEEEQRRIRIDLEELLNDIEQHAAQLPDDESLDELRNTATEFVTAVRESGAADEMAEAENGLAEFSGTRGHEGAEEAADILEQFLSKCDKMGKSGAGKACRRFQPGLSDAMQQTLDQMLQGMQPGMSSGMSSGMGSGGGQSGNSARRNNVGLYGDTPLTESSAGGTEGSSSENSRARSGRDGGNGRGRSDDDEAHDADSALRASGANDAAVPLRYRRQVGRYFQRIADELGDN